MNYIGACAMKIHNAVALVTGANRGLGLTFAKSLLARGARKVYAAARDPASIALPGVTSIRLDVTSLDEIAEAARLCGDVDLLVNNAGIAKSAVCFPPKAWKPHEPRWKPIILVRSP
jgi:NAD(P)-dependent dehydrogenase (short-subunit alcohol dehydrogenase family)